MDAQNAIDLGREALTTCMVIGAPVLIVGLVAGILIGILQAMTQVQDQTIAFVPKVILIVVAICLCLPWLADRMLEYSKSVFKKPAIGATSIYSGSE